MSTPTLRTYEPPLYGTPEQPIRRNRETAPVVSTAPTTDTKSALGVIRLLLAEVFGGALTNYAETAWSRYNSGEPIEVILEDLRNTEAYKTRFSGQEGFQRLYGYRMSEAEYLDVERRAREVGRQFGLPEGFLDNDYIGRSVIGAGQSPVEFQTRLQAWQSYTRETLDLTAAEEYRRYFGLTDGDFLAAALDPTRAISVLERNLEAGRIGTEAIRAGYGRLDTEEARLLADQGVDQRAAREGFDVLAESTELFAPLPGESGSETFGREQQMVAAFDSGGGTAQSRSGITGLARAT